MSNAFEAGVRAEGARRSRLGKAMLFVLLLILLLLFGLWVAVTQPVLTRGLSAGERADPARLEAHVRALCVTYAPRDGGHPENMERAALYLRGEFERAGAAVSEQPFEAGGRAYRNVVASFGPETRERVVVGAHYDAFGSMPGADDNASGVAGLLELARLLARTPPPARVELVAYALEEPPYFRSPHMGSRVHADSLAAAGARVRLMISLEMIGYFRDADGSQRYPSSLFGALYPTRGNFIAVVGRFGQGSAVRRVKRAMRAAAPLPVRSVNAPASVPGVDFSDHLNYWRHGFDAVMITDTAFYRNPNYHTPHDTPDTLDYPRMAQVVAGVHAAVLAEK